MSLPKKYRPPGCCPAAEGTVWWMRADLTPLPPVRDPQKGRKSAASPGIVGPARDGWGYNVRCWGDPRRSNAVIYESANLDACPHCGADLTVIPRPGA